MRNKELLGAVSIVAAGAALHSAVEATPVHAESNSTVSPKNVADTYIPGEETNKLMNMFTTEPFEEEVLMKAMSVNGVNGQETPEFKLGFKALCDALGEEQCERIVGEPLENEHWGDNGDSLQQTSKGLMAWRKADNWTAFTNGSQTWINGPYGIQERGNNERFPWENDGQTKEMDQGQYKAIDSLETTVNGNTYRVKTMASAAAPYTIGINESKRTELNKFIAQEGQINGFTEVRYIAIGPNEVLDVPRDAITQRGTREYPFGWFGVKRSGDVLTIFWKQDMRTPFGQPGVIEEVRVGVQSQLVKWCITGGKDTYGNNLTSDQIDRLNGTRDWGYTVFTIKQQASAK